MNIFNLASTDLKLRQLLDEALRAAGTSEGSILLLTEDGERLRFVVTHSNVADKLLGHEQPIDQGIVGQAVKSGTPKVANEVEHEKAFDPSVDEKTGTTTKSIMAIPLVVSARRFGVLTAINSAAPGGFSENDKERFAIFGDQIAQRLASLG